MDRHDNEDPIVRKSGAAEGQPVKTAPLPMLGLEADPAIEARRQRRLDAVGQTALALSTISLTLMALALLINLSLIVFPPLARSSEAHGGAGLLCFGLLIVFGLVLVLIGYVLSLFASQTTAGKRASARSMYALGIFLIALFSFSFHVR